MSYWPRDASNGRVGISGGQFHVETPTGEDSRSTAIGDFREPPLGRYLAFPAASMTSPLTLRELVRRGVQLAPHEAVAIAQQLIVSIDDDWPLVEPLGPPSLDTVELAADGSVVCRSSATVPAVFEIAILLDALLPKGAARGSGGLRYAIARAFMEVDAPPFESIAEFSEVLARHERGDRQAVLRALYARAARHSRSARVAGEEDRRRRGPSVVTLRHRLREADESIFYLLQANPAERINPVVAPQVDDVGARPPVAADDVVKSSPSDESNSGRFLFVRESLVETARRERPLIPLFAEMRLRKRSGFRPLAAVAALLISIAAGYAVLREYRDARQIAAGGANGSPSAAARAANGSSSTDAGAATPASLAPRALDEQSPRQPASADVSRPPAPMRQSTTAATVAAAVSAPRSRAVPSRESFAWTSRLPDTRNAVQGSDFGRDLQVLTIADAGARSANLQPSPDGTLVTFDSERDGERGVYVARRTGEDVHRVSGTGFAAVPSWSPDSRTLAFLRAETDRPRILNLWLLDAGAGTMRRLTAFRSGETTGAAWFADGRRVAYAHDGRIIVQDIDGSPNVDVESRSAPSPHPPSRSARDLGGSSIREYLSPVPRRSVRGLAVSPDGRHVIFQVVGSSAWLLDLRDGSTRCVLTDPTAESFAWSADGRRVAYYSRRDNEWGVWIMAPQS